MVQALHWRVAKRAGIGVGAVRLCERDVFNGDVGRVAEQRPASA